MPPTMPSEAVWSPRAFMTVWPTNTAASRIASAIMLSRSMMRRRVAGKRPESVTVAMIITQWRRRGWEFQ